MRQARGVPAGDTLSILRLASFGRLPVGKHLIASYVLRSQTLLLAYLRAAGFANAGFARISCAERLVICRPHSAGAASYDTLRGLASGSPLFPGQAHTA